MAWTIKKPRQPGWYWYRGGTDSLPLAVEVMNWSPLPGRPRELHMFYPPRSPEETGICSLDLADAGEWEGPIEPGIGIGPVAAVKPKPKPVLPIHPPLPPHVVQAPPIVKVVEKTKVVEKVVDRIVEKIVNTAGEKTGDPELMKEILAWFVTLGADYLPHEIHQSQLVDLANMLSPAFGVKTQFSSVNDVVGFMMNGSRSAPDDLTPTNE